MPNSLDKIKRVNGNIKIKVAAKTNDDVIFNLAGRRVKVYHIGSLLAFETPTGPVSYDMASDDEDGKNNFLKLFRREEKRLGKLHLTQLKVYAMRTKPWRQAISAYSLAALILLSGAFTLVNSRQAHADDREPPANVTRCDSIEQLEEDYPKSHFTKPSPDETTAFINKYPDPANKMVIFYVVPYPKDPHVAVVHGYTINGCWAGAWQLPADAFEQVIHSGAL